MGLISRVSSRTYRNNNMVFLKIKTGQEHIFNYEVPVDTTVEEATTKIIQIHNHRLKLIRICDEMTQLAKHGVQIRPEMMGLTEDQIVELKLIDEYADKCVPSTGFGDECKDDVGRRCGRPPRVDMKNIIARCIAEATQAVIKNNSKKMSYDLVDEHISNLRGAVMIVYPMGLPPYDHINLEFNNEEEDALAGTQNSKAIINDGGSLWFAGNQMVTDQGKLLSHYVGKNDRSRVVVKVQKRLSQQAPAREPQMTEEEHKKLMSKMYRRQEEMKKLAEEAEFDQDSYLDSQWADSGALKRQFQGLNNLKGFN